MLSDAKQPLACLCYCLVLFVQPKVHVLHLSSGECLQLAHGFYCLFCWSCIRHTIFYAYGNAGS